MILTRKHRLALISELVKAKEDLDNSKACLNSQESKEVKEHFEIAMFLAEQRVKLIEQSLIDNEIDF